MIILQLDNFYLIMAATMFLGMHTTLGAIITGGSVKTN